MYELLGIETSAKDFPRYMSDGPLPRTRKGGEEHRVQPGEGENHRGCVDEKSVPDPGRIARNPPFTCHLRCGRYLRYVNEQLRVKFKNITVELLHG